VEKARKIGIWQRMSGGFSHYSAAIIESIARFVIRMRGTFFILFIIMTAFLLYNAIKVPVGTSLRDLLPKHPYTQLASKYEVFGGSDRVLIVVSSKKGDIFNYKTLRKIIEISDEMKFMSGVDRNKVYSIGVPKIKDFKVSDWGLEFPSLMYPGPPKTDKEMEGLKKNIYRNTLYYGRLVSVDSKAAVVSAEFFLDKVDYGLIYKHLSALKEKYSDEETEIYIEGTPYLYGFFEANIPETLKLVFITLGTIFLLSYLFTKDWRLTFIPGFIMILSAVWGIGFIRLFGFNIDPLIVVVMLLLCARSLCHSLQFSWRIHEELIATNDIKTACFNTVRGLFYPGIAGIITDGVGILIIAFIPVPLMFKVGLSFFVWAMGMVVVVLFFNPIIYLFVPLPKLEKSKRWREKLKEGFLEKRIMGSIASITTGKGTRKAKVVLACALIAFVASLYLAKDISVGDVQTGSPLLKPSSDYNKDAKQIGEIFPGLMDPLMIIVDAKKPGGVINSNLMSAMSEMQASVSSTLKCRIKAR